MARRPYPSLMAVSLALLCGLVVMPATARTLEVGPGKAYASVSAAADAAKDGDRIVIAAGKYFDCAFLRANNITVEGAGPDASAILTDKTCGGKGILVTSGNDITIRNLTLTRARVPDGNGAGIRAESGNLIVDHVKFINNQNGILGNGGPDTTFLIRDSEFNRNGACNGSCAHGIYVGPIKLLRVEHSTFIATKQAHHIKSRAARTEVIGCDIRDGDDGTASYLIDIPNGGSVVVRGNTMEKGPKAENHVAAIMIGEEGITQPTDEITVENNSFRNDGDYATTFVVNGTATEASVRHNKLAGTVQALHGDGATD